MKPLLLNEEQKNQLFEMIEEYFPDEKVKQSHISDDLIFYFKEGFSVISWYQFCLLFLAEKILNNGSLKEHISSDYEKWIWEALVIQVHPIDYLYKKFKNKNYAEIGRIP